MNWSKINERDKQFAQETVRLWNLDDKELIEELNTYNIKDIACVRLHRVYGVRTRIPSLHHILRPGDLEFNYD